MIERLSDWQTRMENNIQEMREELADQRTVLNLMKALLGQHERIAFTTIRDSQTISEPDSQESATEA